MPNWKENLKQSQGQGKDYIHMLPLIIFDVRKVENENAAAFEYYNKADEKRYQIQQPLSGIVIGKAMRAFYWDQANSIMYSSLDYFSHKELVFFSRNSKDKKPVFKGTYDDAVAFFKGRPVQKQIVYLATRKGLYAIIFNLSIAIDQLRQTKPDLAEYEMKFTPLVYNGKESWISAGTKEILAKVALKNNPCYCRIEKSILITDEMAVLYNLEMLTSKFRDYREANTGVAAQPEMVKEEQDADFEPTIERMPEPEPIIQPPVTPSDDLPF